MYRRSVRGPGITLKELWTKEVNISEVKTSCEYVTELCEHLEDSLKLAQEELQKSQKRYKKHYSKKAKPRHLEVGAQVLILLPTENNKLLMQWRGPYIVESRVGLSGVSSCIYDIVISSDSWEEHVKTLQELFGRLRRANITVRPEKYLLGANRIEFLCHQIGGDVITPSGDNLEKVRKTPHLSTKKQVRSFLGLVGHYRDQMPGVTYKLQG